jgi:predicted  nucleic acid-binding Zn-ribbon protein
LSIKTKVHFFNSTNQNNEQILKYFKHINTQRASSYDSLLSESSKVQLISRDVESSLKEVSSLFDQEYAQMRDEIRQIRSYILNLVEELDDLNLFEILITENIEQFNQRFNKLIFN